MMVRLTCCVPFCRRTYRNDEGFAEWICAPHWRAVPLRYRRFRRKARNAYDAAQARCDAIGAEGYEYAKANDACISDEIMERFSAASGRRKLKRQQADRAWDRCKRIAIERAMGIAG